MKKLELLISHVRDVTENINLNALPNDRMVQFFNDAQQRIQSIVFQAHGPNNIFSTTGYKTLSVNTQEYDISILESLDGLTTFKSRMYAKNGIGLVERSDSGSYFFPLPKISTKERRTGWGYIVSDGLLILSNQNNYGQLRITYTKKLNDLDIRRGKIGTVNAGVSLVLSSGTVPTGTDFANIDQISVINADGGIVLSEVPISAYDTGTRTLTTTSPLTGVTANMYVCYNGFSTNVSQLDDTCERYLVEYVCARIQMKDSSSDIVHQSALLQGLEKEILTLFADNSEENENIPIINQDYLNY